MDYVNSQNHYEHESKNFQIEMNLFMIYTLVLSAKFMAKFST